MTKGVFSSSRSLREPPGLGCEPDQHQRQQQYWHVRRDKRNHVHRSAVRPAAGLHATLRSQQRWRRQQPGRKQRDQQQQQLCRQPGRASRDVCTPDSYLKHSPPWEPARLGRGVQVGQAGGGMVEDTGGEGRYPQRSDCLTPKGKEKYTCIYIKKIE